MLSLQIHLEVKLFYMCVIFLRAIHVYLYVNSMCASSCYQWWSYAELTCLVEESISLTHSSCSLRVPRKEKGNNHINDCHVMYISTLHLVCGHTITEYATEVVNQPIPVLLAILRGGEEGRERGEDGERGRERGREGRGSWGETREEGGKGHTISHISNMYHT